MTDQATTPLDRVRSLRRVRQVREFTEEPVATEDLDAIVSVARWSGSSRNSQPWQFIVIARVETIREIFEAGQPQTRALRTAMAAIAVALPDEPASEVSRAYDDGRVAERILIAASLLDLGAGIAWVRPDVRDAVRGILGIPGDWMVRTTMALGHPTDAARQPKSAPGEARRPADEVVFHERWPAG